MTRGKCLDGLDEAVTGLSAGESATFASKLVSGPLKDEEADIQVTVTKVEASELPDADDEFAQEASEFDTIEELRASIEDRLTRIARLEQASQARDAVLENLVGQVDIEVPRTCSTPRSTLVVSRSPSSSPGRAYRRPVPRRYGQEQTEDEFWIDLEDRPGGPQGPDHLGQGGREDSSMLIRTTSPSTSCVRLRAMAFRRSRSPIT